MLPDWLCLNFSLNFGLLLLLLLRVELTKLGKHFSIPWNACNQKIISLKMAHYTNTTNAQWLERGQFLGKHKQINREVIGSNPGQETYSVLNTKAFLNTYDINKD